MMNHRQITKLLFALSFIIFVSCQEEAVSTEPSVDQDDVAAAEALMADFLEENGLKEEAAARGANAYALTILACGDDNNLYYYTAPSGMQGYELLNEETVTASVEGGGYIFWYGAYNIKFLRGIEFDANSQDILGNIPDSWKNSKLWYVQIPEVSDATLKYDIIYQTRKGSGPERLDPKIKVVQ